MYKKLSSLTFAVIIMGMAFFGFYKESGNTSLNKTSTNDVYKYIAINQVLMWVSNNGDGSHDPRTDGNGFYWPGGENATQSAIFEDGLIWGGKVGREVRVNGSTYRQGLQAGKILEDGTPDDPGLAKYTIYKIRKGWENLPPGPTRDDYETAYNEWPVEDGAPWVDVDGDGVYTKGIDEPEFVGDEVLWFVSNDMDPGRSTFTYGTLPLGLEVQATIFGFNKTGDLGDMVFKKYLFINKGNITVRDMIVGMWSDTDMGTADDDFTACDTVLSLGFTYNGDAVDGIYTDVPPAVGYDFFQGPIVPADDPVAQQYNVPDSAKFLGEWRKGYSNLPMTAFAFYINGSNVYSDPQLGVAEGSIEFYYYLQGKVWNGDPFVDPNTGEETVYVLAGDPVAGTGWYEGPGWPGGESPGDRRHLMASGPFTMTPGDTQEVVVGLVIAVGADALSSITELKRKDLAAQTAYDLDFQLTDSPPPPKLHADTGDKQITLWWEDNAESYDAGDPLIYGLNLADTTYTFQGYRLWQFADQTGAKQTLIGIWDLQDTIETIYDNVVINGENVSAPVIKGPNEGIRRFKFLTQDALNNNLTFNNGNPYYFGITAYGYSANSSPTYLESTPAILEVIPGKKRIDYTTPYSSGENIYANATAGYADANVRFKIIDPSALSGDTYSVEFHGAEDSLYYNLLNETTGDTLFTNETDFVELVKDEFGEWVITEDDTSGKKLYDGFQLLVQDLAADSFKVKIAKYLVKAVQETSGPGGLPLSDPVDVFYSTNSTGKWMVKAKGPSNGKLNWQTTVTQQGLGFTDYEIRFTGTSQYYLNGYNFGFPTVQPILSDVRAKDTVPFEVWSLGEDLDDPTDDIRLIVKVVDMNRSDTTAAITDSTWSQLPNGDWEELYVYSTTKFPADSLPDKSGPSKYPEHKFGGFVFSGDLPEAGTVVRVVSMKRPHEGDVFKVTLQAPNLADLEAAKANIDEGISVFPNPYFGAQSLELDKYRRFVRFTGLPVKAVIRIYSLGGVFINKFDKNDSGQYLDWNLLNSDGLPVASGMYIAYIDMPGVGTKIMKLAIIQEQQYIDRL